MTRPRDWERDFCKKCGVEICYEPTRYGNWWRHTNNPPIEAHPAEPTNWQLIGRECKFNCNSEGPPGPIWCTECGHDPKCCNCELEYERTTSDTQT